MNTILLSRMIRKGIMQWTKDNDLKMGEYQVVFLAHKVITRWASNQSTHEFNKENVNWTSFGTPWPAAKFTVGCIVFSWWGHKMLMLLRCCVGDNIILQGYLDDYCLQTNPQLATWGTLNFMITSKYKSIASYKQEHCLIRILIHRTTIYNITHVRNHRIFQTNFSHCLNTLDYSIFVHLLKLQTNFWGIWQRSWCTKRCVQMHKQKFVRMFHEY